MVYNPYWTMWIQEFCMIGLVIDDGLSAYQYRYTVCLHIVHVSSYIAKNKNIYEC